MIFHLLIPLLLGASGDSTIQESIQRSPHSDSVVADSLTNDTMGIRRLPTTTVVGVRHSRPERVAPGRWTDHAGAGQSGPLETLRDRAGISSQGEFSGQVSSTGMPFEGSLVTWDGGEIPWPWHFGGMFGVLDASAVGQVSWDPTGDGPSATRGGGWLQSQSKAVTAGPDGWHGSVEGGTIDGSVATWGRRGDWSFQGSFRRTWLDPALDLAHHQGWSPQKLVILFWDGTAALAWSNGAWSARVGAFLSKDSLSIGTESDYGLIASWKNTVVPAAISWKRDGWELETQGSWSKYSRHDDGLDATDTLEQSTASSILRRELSDNFRMETGLRIRRWNSGYAEYGQPVPGFPGDTRKTLLEPWSSATFAAAPWTAAAWGGIAHDERDEASPQGGARLGWTQGPWSFQTDILHKIVPLDIAGSLVDGTESPSPVWILPPGPSPRTTAFHLSALHEQAGSGQIPSTEFRGLGWIRSTRGIWQWEGSSDYSAGRNPIVRQSYRQDAGSAGLDVSGRILFDRLELAARQSISWDVVERDPVEGTTFPARWAPWDQRYQTEFDFGWAWKGLMRSVPGATFLRSRLTLHRNSGTLRPYVAGWTAPSRGQILDTFLVDWSRINGSRRSPYLRLDATVLEFGREGSWTAFWTIVNLTAESNAVGWFSSDPSSPPHPIDQIPFLPVVFGVRFLF